MNGTEVKSVNDVKELMKQLRDTELDNFENAMSLRQEADYALTFSQEGAQRVVKDAEAFVQAARTMVEEGDRSAKP
jgi:uncharacterized protein (UPF0332 family)